MNTHSTHRRTNSFGPIARIWTAALPLAFLLLTEAPSPALEIEYIEPGGFFSQAVVVKHAGVRTIYISGQVGQGEGLEAQLASAFAAVGAQLEAAGASPQDLARIRIYVPNFKPEDYPLVSEARAALFEGIDNPRFPASTLLGVQSLMYDRFQCEVQAIAVMAEPGSGAVLEKEHIDSARGFSQLVVVKSGGVKTVYVSGQVGQGDDLASQAISVYQNIKQRLESVGATTRDIVKVNTYIVDYTMADIAVLGPATEGLFDEGKYPANTLTGIHSLALDRFKIEVDSIAVLKDEGSGVEIKKEYIDPSGGFTQIVSVEAGGVKTHYISGQTGQLTSDLSTQADQAYGGLMGRLDSVGASQSDLVMQNIYMTNYKEGDSNVLGAARRSGVVAETNNATSTLIGVNSLYSPQTLIEVEGIAITESSGQ